MPDRKQTDRLFEIFFTFEYVEKKYPPLKNEERIIELLLEYIARTDKMEKEFTEEMLQLSRDFNQTNSRQGE